MVSRSGDSTLISLDPNQHLGFERETMQLPNYRLQVLVATRRQTTSGAILLGFAGAATGVVIGARLDKTCWSTPTSAPQQFCDTGTGAQKALGVGGALLGASLGALMGHAVK